MTDQKRDTDQPDTDQDTDQDTPAVQVNADQADVNVDPQTSPNRPGQRDDDDDDQDDTDDDDDDTA